ncbi:MAG: hypothetical protein KC620_08020, partial [Myxococcales bacterium]|nr:hypothetical protein [Myxococcales bacterium]
APFEGPPPQRLPPFEPPPGARSGSLTVLSASADRQTAQECRPADGQGQSHGVFTRCLLELLDREGDRPTWRETHDRLLPAVRAVNPRQTPQLEGDGVDRVVFGKEERPLVGHCRLSRTADGLRLEAGALHGLAPGRILEVVPLGAAHASGRVKVVNAQPCLSTAEIVDGRVPCPARARLPTQDAPFDVRLHVPANLQALMAPHFASCAHVTLVEAEDADVVLAGSTTALSLTSPLIAPQPTFAADAAPSVLRRWSAWFGLHRLKGGRLDVDVRLSRRDETRPRDDDRPVVLSEGEIFIVKATNRSPMSAHIEILELADDGRISVRDWAGSTAPGWKARADQPVAPGRTVFLAGRAKLPAGRSRDRCVFVAIATLTPTRFHGLVAESVRDGPSAGPDLLDRMLRPRPSAGRPPEATAYRWGVGHAVYETERAAP